VKLCGLPAALLVSVIEPSLAPAAAGVKVTLRLQEAPAARLLPQPCVTAKTGIEGKTLVMFKAALPVLVRVTVFAALVVPAT
jgi:hypothetical protein